MKQYTTFPGSLVPSVGTFYHNRGRVTSVYNVAQPQDAHRKGTIIMTEKTEEKVEEESTEENVPTWDTVEQEKRKAEWIKGKETNVLLLTDFWTKYNFHQRTAQLVVAHKYGKPREINSAAKYFLIARDSWVDHGGLVPFYDWINDEETPSFTRRLYDAATDILVNISDTGAELDFEEHLRKLPKKYAWFYHTLKPTLGTYFNSACVGLVAADMFGGIKDLERALERYDKDRTKGFYGVDPIKMVLDYPFSAYQRNLVAVCELIFSRC